MTSGYSPERMARGAIRIGCARLAGSFPFHARVLERFNLVCAPAVETMGVTATARGVLLLFSPEFVLDLSADALGAVLLHEVHHVVLGHLSLDLTKFTDVWAFIVACEVSANEFVTLPLPIDAIRLEQFPGLPPMESTPERYRRLTATPAHARFAVSGVAAGNPAAANGGSAATRGVLDNHVVWQDGTGDPAAVREAVAALLNEAAAEAGEVPPALRGHLRAIGRGTAADVYVVAGNAQGALDWRQLLRRYVGRHTQVQGCYSRPPRRFPELVGVVPGRLRRRNDAAVVAVLDTSGSIDDPTIEAIDGELRRMAKHRDVVVVEADCVVHRTYRYRTRLEYVQGRGGTDLRPALDRHFLAPLKPEVVVYFTDGAGPAPASKPAWPLVWCLVPGGEPPASYGHVIRMGESG